MNKNNCFIEVINILNSDLNSLTISHSFLEEKYQELKKQTEEREELVRNMIKNLDELVADKGYLEACLTEVLI